MSRCPLGRNGFQFCQLASNGPFPGRNRLGQTQVDEYYGDSSQKNDSREHLDLDVDDAGNDQGPNELHDGSRHEHDAPDWIFKQDRHVLRIQ